MAGSSFRKPVAAGFAVILVVAAVVSCVRGFGARRPNVVIIVVDALRQDHLPMYGYPRNVAPFLSDLARRSAVFDAMSTTSWTKPAVLSLLTGLHPVRHQTFGRIDVVPPDVVTLPELLAGSGYDSYGITANGWISAPNGFLPGFKTLDVVEPTGPSSPASAQLVNLIALGRLRRASGPFFVYIHYVDTHLPYRPATSWEGKRIPPQRRRSVSETDLRSSDFLNRPPEVISQAVDLYDGGIRQVDNAIAEIFSVLRERGVLENTIVIITADHGEEFQDHGRMGHGHSLYQEVTKVPLLITGPGIRPGVRHGAVSLMDIVPTLADALGLKVPQPADGRSLRANLADASMRIDDRDLLLHLDYTEVAGASSSGTVRVPATVLALIRGQSKLVLSRAPFVKTLFDLDADPAELHNRFADDPGVTSSLASALAARYNELSRRKERRVTMQNATEMQRAVAALGYITGNTSIEPRSIPARISPADSYLDGRLGWAGDLDRCIHLADRDHSRQLLLGWYEAESDGRWTGATATAVLPIAETSAQRLLITGRNGRPQPVHVRIDVGASPVAEKDLLPGSFIWNIPLSPRDRTTAVTRLTATTTYRPSDFGSPDTRELGIYISSMCVE